MSALVPAISDIVLSIDNLDIIVESFQKGYLDNVDEVSSIEDQYSGLLKLLELIKQNKCFRNANMGPFWEEIGQEIDGKRFSMMEALLSVFYFILINKEKYSTDFPLLCSDLYMHILLLPGAFGHGMIRCSLLQVTVSAINRSINNDDIIHMDTPYKTTATSLVNTLLTTMEVLDELTINFTWIELSSLCYECCFNSLLIKQLAALFTKLLQVSEKDSDVRMGELLRVLLPILSLYQEGRKIDDKVTRQSQQTLLSILNTNVKPCFHNCKYALYQRLFINCPDRVDDKRNTVNTILSIMCAVPVEERERYHSWLYNCSLCNAYNVRVCSIHVAKALLMTNYVKEIENWKADKQMEIENQDEEEAFVIEPGTLSKDLFKDTNLKQTLFMLIVHRCQDITISIRSDAIHLLGDLLEHINSTPQSGLQEIFDEETMKVVYTAVTNCIMDTAVGVRKNALTTYAAMVLNPLIRPVIPESEMIETVCNLLQDSAVSVRKSALQLYYKILPLIPAFIPYFFPISISMFENTSNTDSLIIKVCQQFVLDPIIIWKNNVNYIDGWKYMEYFTSNNIPVLESILKLLIEKNTLPIGKLVASCIAAITWYNTVDIEADEIKEQLPHIEENAWLLLSILVKFYKRVDIDFITNQIEKLIDNNAQSLNVNRDKYIIQLAITVMPRVDTKKVKQMYSKLANEILKLKMHIDLIHSYLRLYLTLIDTLYKDLPSVQKAVNMLVQRMEKKVDKILQEFIFRSGGKVRLDLPPSQAMTQRLPSSQEIDPGFSQPFNQEDEDPMNTSTLLDDNPDFSWLFPYIFIMGEMCVLGMEESEEGNLSKLSIHMSNRSVALLQALTTNSLPSISSSQGVSIPSCIRAHAFISFGKMCITSVTLAKKHLPMFIRELELSKDSAIRNNIIIIIGDICSKHTSIVERYIPTIANCIVDSDVVVRVHALSIISKLILEDYIKLKSALLCCLLSSLIDSDDSIASFSYQLITKQIFRKFPKIFVTNFVEIVCILNGYLDPSIIKEAGVKQIDIHLEGGDRKKVNARKRIYRVILEQLDDESKLQISCKLCQKILGPLVDDDGVQTISNDIDSPQLNTVKDAFTILCSKELKIGSRTKAEDEDLPAEVLESKKAVLSKLEKRTMLEQVLPLLISLKIQLEKKRSILLRDLMLYFKVITVNFKQEMEVVFQDNPRLKREIEYDIRHFDEMNTKESTSLMNTVNTLATPVIHRTVKTVDAANSTPQLKTTTPKIHQPSNQPVVTPSGSLEIRMSLTPEEKEKEEWKMDARRLSFTSPAKELTQQKKIDSDEDSFNFASSDDDVKETLQKKTSKKRPNVE